MGKSNIKPELKEEEMKLDMSTTTTSTVRVAAVGKEEYAKLCEDVNSIAQPLAGRKTARKIYKLLQQAKADKNNMRQGLFEVMKAFRKDEGGLVVMAGDVWPMDMYSHIPAICEERGLPYIYTPSRRHLGWSVGYSRPMIAVLIKRNEQYGELYDEISENAKTLNLSIS